MVGFFQYRAGLGRVLTKSQVAGRFRSGITVEIFDQVFPGTVFTVFLGILGIKDIPNVWIYQVYLIFWVT